LEKLCRTYWWPLYGFVRRQGSSPEEAQDLTQGFFAMLLERRDFESVRREKGRLRSYLLVSLKNFLAKAHRREMAVKRGEGQPLVPLDELMALDDRSLADIGIHRSQIPNLVMSFEQAAQVEVIRPANIVPPPEVPPLPDELEGRTLIVLPDDVSTGDMAPDGALVLNADDPVVASYAGLGTAPIVWYGLDGPRPGGVAGAQAVEGQAKAWFGGGAPGRREARSSGAGARSLRAARWRIALAPSPSRPPRGSRGFQEEAGFSAAQNSWRYATKHRCLVAEPALSETAGAETLRVAVGCRSAAAVGVWRGDVSPIGLARHEGG